MEPANALVRHVGRNEFSGVCLYCGKPVEVDEGELFVDEKYSKSFVVHRRDCEPCQKIIDHREKLGREEETLTGYVVGIGICSFIVIMIGVLFT